MRSPSASSRNPLLGKGATTMKPPAASPISAVTKLFLSASIFAMVALLTVKVLQLSRQSAHLPECVMRLAAATVERDALKQKVEDGSLLAGLTAASFNVKVARANEDILRMSPEAMAKQIEQLREIVNTYNAVNKRLAAEKRQLAEEKKQETDKLARLAVTSSADSSAGHQDCNTKLRAMAVEATSLKDDLETAKAEHMTTKSRLDEVKDQLKSADVAVATAKNDVLGLVAKLEQTRMRLNKCGSGASLVPVSLRIGSLSMASASTTANAGGDKGYQGYKCEATEADMKRYLDYTPRQSCPNDWYFVQRLIFKKNCFSLPRRKCRVPTPARPADPLPFPQSLFDQSSLKSRNVRWDLHQYKSFEALNSRNKGDCRNCFNLTLEETRWQYPFRGTIPMKDVVAMKKGTLRLGIDIGGGTGSFAAHMARFGVTVMTTAFNVETISGKKAGLPYMETIAARGLIPLHNPHAARLPLYDGVLDVVHSVNSIKYIPLEEFEELIYEWDRVLRVGGIFWFEMFYAPVTDMPKYVAVIEQVNYKKLYWNFSPKPDAGEVGGEHVYLNCVLEKQPAPGKQVLVGPPAEDMEDIV